MILERDVTWPKSVTRSSVSLSPCNASWRRHILLTGAREGVAVCPVHMKTDDVAVFIGHKQKMNTAHLGSNVTFSVIIQVKRVQSSSMFVTQRPEPGSAPYFLWEELIIQWQQNVWTRDHILFPFKASGKNWGSADVLHVQAMMEKKTLSHKAKDQRRE